MKMNSVIENTNLLKIYSSDSCNFLRNRTMNLICKAYIIKSDTDLSEELIDISLSR